jgi:hypothetical protein
MSGIGYGVVGGRCEDMVKKSNNSHAISDQM